MTPTFVVQQQRLAFRAKIARRGQMFYGDNQKGFKADPYRRQRLSEAELRRLLATAHNKGQRRRYAKALNRFRS